jgi:uncharacterized phage protein gp47/JayE
MALNAFQPSGNTFLIAATSSTASTPTQVCAGSQQGMRIANTSTASVPVYVAAGSSSVQAACPTTATPAAGVCIPAQTAVNLVTPPAGWLSAATSAGSVSVFATPGFGGS